MKREEVQDPKETLDESMITDPSALKRESRRRKSPFEFCSVKKDEASGLLEQGWEIDRELVYKTKLRRPKGIDKRLEDRLWSLLYKLGYPELNQGGSLEINTIRRGGVERIEKVSVLAKDRETVIVAKCQSTGTIARMRLHGRLSEFSDAKGPLAAVIKEHYGRSLKPKILWFFTTENIVWSASDKEFADEENISRITEKELRYFNQIANHLGPAARYQFLAEFLADQRIPALSNRIVPALRGRLGGHKFYAFVTTPEHLLKIAFVNHRSLNDPQGIPAYQRLVSRGRIRRIERFLLDGGYFPTNVLVNFPKKLRFDVVHRDREADVTFGHLYLPDRYKSAWIIDGQHRLYGYSRLGSEFRSQNIAVVAFERMPTEEEANLFVTINHEQKSVPRNLLDDLEGDLKWGSEVPAERIGSIAARLIQILNEDIGEPFYGRVVAQGIKATERVCLTVPQVKDGLKKSGLIGRVESRGKELVLGPLSGSSDTSTVDRARSVLNLYFRQIQESNRNLWELGRDGAVCTNAGVQGYLYLLAAIIRDLEQKELGHCDKLEPDELVLQVYPYLREFLQDLSGLPASRARQLFKERIPYGAGGPREYFFRLCQAVREHVASFAPDGYREWEEERSEERVLRAEAQLKEINVLVQELFFSRMKERFGDSKYFELGVWKKQVRVRAYERQQDDPENRRLPLENYLNFSEYKDLVASSEHWPYFKAYLDIPEKGQKGRAKNLSWMTRVNELRRIPAHPGTQRRFKIDDFEYLDWLVEELRSRSGTSNERLFESESRETS